MNSYETWSITFFILIFGAILPILVIMIGVMCMEWNRERKTAAEMAKLLRSSTDRRIGSLTEGFVRHERIVNWLIDVFKDTDCPLVQETVVPNILEEDHSDVA